MLSPLPLPALPAAPVARRLEKAGVVPSFPLLAKGDVNGAGAHPAYQWAKARLGVHDIKWNFAKFLVNSDGTVLEYFRPDAEYDAVEVAIRAQLRKSGFKNLRHFHYSPDEKKLFGELKPEL